MHKPFYVYNNKLACEFCFSFFVPSLIVERRVVEELLDEVDVAQQHAAAAVALHPQGVEGVAAETISTRNQFDK